MHNQGSIENNFENEFSVSNVTTYYAKNGKVSFYEVAVSVNVIDEYRVLKSKSIRELEILLNKTLGSLEKKYHAYIKQKSDEKNSNYVNELNAKIKKERAVLKNILQETLSIDDALDFESLKIDAKFKINPSMLFSDGVIPDYFSFDWSGKPIKIHYVPVPEMPTLDTIRREMGIIRKIFFPKTVEKELNKRTKKWEASLINIKFKNTQMKKEFEAAFIKYMDQKNNYEEKKNNFNSTIEFLKKNYFAKKLEAIEEYCNQVLQISEYPKWFPKKWDLEYVGSNKTLIIEYLLPSPEEYPTVDSYLYDKKNCKITAKKISEKELSSLYNDLIHQIVLRTIHELFEADVINAIDAIGLNGLVDSINKSTGLQTTKMILSIVVNKETFTAINLANVSPKATFKYLKGISAVDLMDLTPIAPQIKINRHDKRFVDSQNVIQDIDQSFNLATMHWEDFEHLIREIFEQEFLVNGGEVRVTQASRDGGVDAIAFDPDPIRGGKIIIQAKRYNNIVGVSAIRDLYGTVLNEGATKGIIVTTSDYGRDSYAFAQNKPLTLINGSNLLAMLEKHGHKARINLKEVDRPGS